MTWFVGDKNKYGEYLEKEKEHQHLSEKLRGFQHKAVGAVAQKRQSVWKKDAGNTNNMINMKDINITSERI